MTSSEESSDEGRVPSWKSPTVAPVKFTIDSALSKHEDKFLKQEKSKRINKEIGSTVEQKVATVLQDAGIEAETGVANEIHYLVRSVVGSHIKCESLIDLSKVEDRFR